MNWLIWKEYRLNRLILIVGAVLVVAPYAVALVLAWRGAGPDASLDGSPVASRLSVNLVVAGVCALGLSQLTLALLGGNLIACERADRSAEFLAYLPISKSRILAGKAALTLATVALVWVPNLLILLGTTAGLPDALRVDFYETARELLLTIAVTGFVFFSVGWLMSSLLTSATFSICIGLITPYFVVLALAGLTYLLGYLPEDVIGLWYRCTCLAIALACLVAGTWCYVRRVEP